MRGATTGFLTLLRGIKDLWDTKEESLRSNSDELTKEIRRYLYSQGVEGDEVPLDASLLTAVHDELVQEFDPQYGGFGFDPGSPSRPKFPEASNLMFLLHQAREGDARAQKMIDVSLEKMHSGGIWDHVGGGFHRYSVDRFWHIPHFEKMLYDNGQLAVVYSEAYELTKKEGYRRVVFRMLDWALREMRDQQGAFYSALDAESEKVEGKFYRWELPEVERILGDDYDTFATIYGLNDPPNFEHEYYVPQLSQPLSEIAAERKTTETALWRELESMHGTLRNVRDKRPRPLTDTKILTSWNGLMIRGLADAGRIFDRPDYVTAASDAANFILTEMRRDDGRLYRTHTAGESKLNAYLDDYAFLCDGLIALHIATGDKRWLQRAAEITDLQIQFYADQANGGFFFTSRDHEALIARGKQTSDGAQPAGNSVAAQNLIYLGRAMNNPTYVEIARKTIAAAAPRIQKSPRSAPRMALALAQLLDE